MLRFPALLLSLLFILITSPVLAQGNGQLRAGDPPVAALIDVSAPDAEGMVKITGAAGAVFPGAQVAIRNLYTEQMVYAQAGVTGSFSAEIFARGNTPFWISPAVTIPVNGRGAAGSLPGGAGTIIYGGRRNSDASAAVVTHLMIDGLLDDWLAYPEAGLIEATNGKVYGLRNSESLYIAWDPQAIPESYWKLRVIFTLEGATYRLTLDPRLPEEAATLQAISPIEQDRGTVAVAKTQADIVEMRFPLETLRSVLGAAVDSASLDRMEFIAADGSALLAIPVMQALPLIEGVDGVVYATPLIDATSFSVAGPVAQGAGVWTATGLINQLQFMPGDHLRLRLDVDFNVPALPESLAGVSMVGVLHLQPIGDADGQPVTGGLNSNSGWSAVLTSGGLAIDNLRSDFWLGETIIPAPQVIRRGDSLVFGLDFDLTLPEHLPAGRYGVLFEGYGQIADGERFRWDSTGLLGQGAGISRVAVNRLPVMLTVGEPAIPRLIWSLFQDSPSDGSRGLLALEDQGTVALSNRVRFNSATYILPPYSVETGELQPYPLEPYLINQLPNAYDSSSAPLIPFLLPGGQFEVSVTRPDGTVQAFDRTTLLQNRLSTAAQDERNRFGAQGVVDTYRLTTLNPALAQYRFEQYGLYTITMKGVLDDIWGNRYQGGGTYEVLVAELLDLRTGVLSGTPFEVGDAFHAGLTVQPGVPADVTITARIYPLDGSPVITHEISGQANQHGYFSAPGFEFITPGEYVLDYEARFTDAQGRLWAASQRSAGVIAVPDSTLIAHGRRGLANDTETGFVPAWFITPNYGPSSGLYALQFPYHIGDVLWYDAQSNVTVQPGITVQDRLGAYTSWLIQTVAGMSNEVAVRGEIPVVMLDENGSTYNPALDVPLANNAYTYFSAVRPGLTVRQMVLGTDDPSLALHWDTADPYNEQIGSGLQGDRPGDYIFMFGGAVIRNEAAGVAETAIYGAAAFVSDETNSARVAPPYRGAAGGADGGPLLTVRGEPVTMFFHPTGVRPGQVLTIGDTLSIAGQVAPTLPSDVQVQITRPDGEIQTFNGTANTIGYYYQPTHDVVVDQTGIWRVTLTVEHRGLSSAGRMVTPYPQGGVLGAEQHTFSVYVVPADSAPLEWSDTRQDISIPGALPYNFNFSVQEGWENPKVEVTVTIPGYILRSGALSLSGTSFSYQHNPTDLNAAFPNLEIDARLDGPAASDPVTMTFVVTDDSGRIRTRTFTLLYDRLLTLES